MVVLFLEWVLVLLIYMQVFGVLLLCLISLQSFDFRILWSIWFEDGDVTFEMDHI